MHIDNKDYTESLPDDLPASWDWRDLVAMTPVRDQNRSNMCWSIVGTDCVSIGHYICEISDKIILLSAKDLFDSANEECWDLESEKGYPYSLKKAFDYMKRVGVMTEQQCPFEPKKSKYKKKSPEEEKTLVRIHSCEEVDCSNELELMKAVTKYPVAGCVELYQDFKHYKGGIYMGTTPEKKKAEKEEQAKKKDGVVAEDAKFNPHAILIVGYGYDEIEDKRYWIVKNSYGEGWGVGGYAKIARQSSLKEGEEPLIFRAVKPIFTKNGPATFRIPTMVKENFEADQLRRIMDHKHNIRNVSVVGHVDHGKTALTNSLLAAAGITTREGDSRAEECSSTLKSNGISLHYEMTNASMKNFHGERQGNEYLFNLIDSPGHVDFSSEVTAALRITDGALVVVDCSEGVCVQTETVLKQAMSERIRPVLTVNKIDRCFLESQVDGEEAYQTLSRVIENVNIILANYEDPLLGDVQVHPEKGSVAFSAGLHGWAFSITQFAKMYASKYSYDESKMKERLWGDNFFDTKSRKWTTKHTGTNTCKRGFVMFCYKPIKQIIDLCMKDKKDKLWANLKSIGIVMNSDETKLTGKALVNCVMQKWFPASNALLEMTIFHLPSPVTAQKYRVANLYAGSLDDKYADAIKNCDPKGPLMIYVSKMIPAPADHKGKYFAFGRVFSGKVSTGSKVRIMGPPGEKKNVCAKTIVEGSVIWMGNKRFKTIEDVPCGNLVAMIGLDRHISKGATLTDEKEVDAHPIRAMNFSVSPLVRVAVQCKLPSDIPKLLEGLKRLAKSDPIVECTIEESGEYIVAGVGELHLKTCFQDLVDDIMGGEVSIIQSDPIVSFRETVIERSSRRIMCKSPNRHNRLYMEARPLEDNLSNVIEKGRMVDPNTRAKILFEEFGWDNALAEKKIWCFGPEETTGPNMMVDMCRGGANKQQLVKEIKDSVVSGFLLATDRGALAEEKMRGVCFEMHDVILHSDAIHRGSGQVIATARRAIHASQLTANPRLMEPVYLVEIQATYKSLGGLTNVINQFRGQVLEVNQQPGGSMSCNIKAHLPVTESFSFMKKLREQTSGNAFPQCVFDHWDVIPSDPLEPNSRAARLVASIRKRKGLKEHMTPLSELEDKLH